MRARRPAAVFNFGGTRFDLYDADFNLLYGLEFGGGGGKGVAIRPSVVDVSTNNVVRDMRFPGTDTAIWIEGGSDNEVLDNDISGSGSYGVYLKSGASATVRDNTITDRTYGVYGTGISSLVIEGNEVSAGSYGLYLSGGDSTVVDNELSGGSYGIYQTGGTGTIDDNTIHHTLIGIYVSGTSVTISNNVVHDTTTGIQSNTGSASVFGNEIYASDTGLLGYGIFGGSDWSAGQPNDIHDNTTGIQANNNATIRFNRIHHNVVGITRLFLEHRCASQRHLPKHAARYLARCRS